MQLELFSYKIKILHTYYAHMNIILKKHDTNMKSCREEEEEKDSPPKRIIGLNLILLAYFFCSRKN